MHRFCNIFSQVENNVGFYLIIFLYKIENVLSTNVSKTFIGIPTIIGVPVKVIYFHGTYSVYSLCLSAVPLVLVETSQMATLLGNS